MLAPAVPVRAFDVDSMLLVLERAGRFIDGLDDIDSLRIFGVAERNVESEGMSEGIDVSTEPELGMMSGSLSARAREFSRNFPFTTKLFSF